MRKGNVIKWGKGHVYVSTDTGEDWFPEQQLRDEQVTMV